MNETSEEDEKEEDKQEEDKQEEGKQEEDKQEEDKQEDKSKKEVNDPMNSSTHDFADDTDDEITEEVHELFSEKMKIPCPSSIFMNSSPFDDGTTDPDGTHKGTTVRSIGHKLQAAITERPHAHLKEIISLCDSEIYIRKIKSFEWSNANDSLMKMLTNFTRWQKSEQNKSKQINVECTHKMPFEMASTGEYSIVESDDNDDESEWNIDKNRDINDLYLTR